MARRPMEEPSSEEEIQAEEEKKQSVSSMIKGFEKELKPKTEEGEGQAVLRIGESAIVERESDEEDEGESEEEQDGMAEPGYGNVSENSSYENNIAEALRMRVDPKFVNFHARLAPDTILGFGIARGMAEWRAQRRQLRSHQEPLAAILIRNIMQCTQSYKGRGFDEITKLVQASKIDGGGRIGDIFNGG